MNPATQSASLPHTHNPTVLNQTTLSPVHYSAKLYAQPMRIEATQNVQTMCLNTNNDQMTQQSQMAHQSQMAMPMNSYASSNLSMESIDHPKKRHLKERAALESVGKSFGRRSHDYNKTQPTPHQTIVYNQVIAQQNNTVQPNTQQQQQTMTNVTSYNQSNFSNPSNVIHQMNPAPIIQTTTNSYPLTNSINALNLSNNLSNSMQMSSYHTATGQTNTQNSMNLVSSAVNNQSLISLLSQNKPQDVSMDSAESYKSITSNHPNVAYKPYPPQKSIKLSPTSNSGELNANELTKERIATTVIIFPLVYFADETIFRIQSIVTVAHFIVKP